MSAVSRITPHFDIENEYNGRGTGHIAGIDEAGRGALAGPLYVGFVIFPEKFYTDVPKELSCIQDSKKLSKLKREKAFDVIAEYAFHFDYEAVPPSLIDELNINRATFYAIEQLATRFPQPISTLFLDGNFRFNSTLPLVSVKKGDQLSISIAAASIVAKVLRDREMEKLALKWPEYGFDAHVGYGTRLHREMIELYGPCECHRRSYEPVKSMVSKNRFLFEE